MKKMKKIILGSNSPRRRELLAGLGFPFTVNTDNSFEEVADPSMPHRLIPAAMAEGKSFGFHRPLSDDEVLVTADTMVLLGDVMLGKPRTHEEAISMLRALSGHTHEVITAVVIRDRDNCRRFEDITRVTFRELTDEEIEWYVDNCRPYDKAGAYGVQEWIGYAAITSIQGSFYNVMGLPVHKVYECLKDFMDL